MANEDSELRRDDGEMERSDESTTADVEGHRKLADPAEDLAASDEPDVEAHRKLADPEERPTY